MSFNRVILEGRLTRDPKLEDKNGTALCNFDLAFDDGFGNYKKVTYVTITTWGKMAKFISEHFTKGSGILVEGRLTQDRWLDKESGAKRQRHRVTAERVNFPVGSSKKTNEYDQGEALPENETQETPAAWATESENQDGHPPF